MKNIKKKIILTILCSVMVLNLTVGQKLDNGMTIDTDLNTSDYGMKSAKVQNDKKKVVVKKIGINDKVDFKEVGLLLETQTKKHPINMVNWVAFDYKPKVEFRIGHTDNEIWLKYYVSEKYIRAMETKTNGSVHKDSCVEFFISFDNLNYYNFEFNCIGTKLVAYGPERNDRKNIDPKVLEAIRINSSLGDQTFEEKEGQFNWELIVIIPVSCFINSDIKTLDGVKATANFYKCGDATSVHHYLSWNRVHTEHPDYHRPEFFGQLCFE